MTPAEQLVIARMNKQITLLAMAVSELIMGHRSIAMTRVAEASKVGEEIVEAYNAMKEESDNVG